MDTTDTTLDTKMFYIFYCDSEGRRTQLTLLRLTPREAEEHLQWRYDILPNGVHFYICIGVLTQREQTECRHLLRQATTEQQSELLNVYLSHRLMQ